MTEPEREKEAREKLARWMISMTFATGHGDSIEDLLKELEWQVDKLRKENSKASALADALREFMGSVTLTYEEQAKKYLKPKFIGKSRVWSDAGCWLNPGDCIYEVNDEDIQKAKSALAAWDGQ